MTKVLFVCLGNICRSPLAKGILSQMIDEQALQDRITCDSCGTAAYHIGSPPDSRTIANAKENGLLLNHQARQFHRADFEEFDYILAMDRSNLSSIKQLDKYQANASKVSLMRNYDVEDVGTDVPDPYYGGIADFQNVYDILYRSCRNLLNHIKNDSGR